MELIHPDLDQDLLLFPHVPCSTVTSFKMGKPFQKIRVLFNGLVELTYLKSWTDIASLFVSFLSWCNLATFSRIQDEIKAKYTACHLVSMQVIGFISLKVSRINIFTLKLSLSVDCKVNGTSCCSVFLESW